MSEQKGGSRFPLAALPVQMCLGRDRSRAPLLRVVVSLCTNERKVTRDGRYCARRSLWQKPIFLKLRKSKDGHRDAVVRNYPIRGGLLRNIVSSEERLVGALNRKSCATLNNKCYVINKHKISIAEIKLSPKLLLKILISQNLFACCKQLHKLNRELNLSRVTVSHFIEFWKLYKAIDNSWRKLAE